MAGSKNNGKEEKINYEEMILDYLRANHTGSTITDIVNGLKISRGTGGKYVSILEAKEKVIKRKIGAYHLYFTSAPRYVPVRAIVLFYKGLLYGLSQKHIKDQEEKERYFKELGFIIADNFNEIFSANLTVPTKTRNYKILLKLLAKLYPNIDVMQYRGVKISAEVNEEGTMANYNFQNVKIFEESEEFLYHFYMITGILEKQLIRLLNKEIKAQVVDFSIENKTLTISVEIKE
jgi:hypothetical protein